MIHFAGNVALQQVERLPITEHVQARPKLFLAIDLRYPNGRHLEARFEHPRWGHAPHKLTNPVIVQDVDKVRHRDTMLPRLEPHCQFVSEVSYRRIAHTRHTQVFPQSCSGRHVIIVQGHNEINNPRAGKEADTENHIFHLR